MKCANVMIAAADDDELISLAWQPFSDCGRTDLIIPVHRSNGNCPVIGNPDDEWRGCHLPRTVANVSLNLPINVVMAAH